MPLEFLRVTLFGNTVGDYVLAALATAGAIAALWGLKTLVLRRLESWAHATETTLDDFVIGVVKKIAMPLFFFGAVYLGLHSLVLNAAVAKALHALAAFVLTFAGVRFAIEITNYLITTYWITSAADAAKRQLLAGLMPIVKGVFWGLGLVFLLDNLGYKVSTVIAGLGIGGMAVALAAQSVLGDLFSYFAIMLDGPFAAGDFIVMGDVSGTIERIGIKTTRVRSLGGELVVVANAHLTESFLRNYQQMRRRRVVLKIGVAYETPTDRLKEVPGVLREVVRRVPETEFERAHFQAYGVFSLDFEAVYHVLSGDYNKYMDVQQAVNYALKEELDARKIEFAYPTQTLLVKKTG